jgi:hypothetical protein
MSSQFLYVSPNYYQFIDVVCHAFLDADSCEKKNLAATVGWVVLEYFGNGYVLDG